MIWKNPSHEFDEAISEGKIPSLKKGVFVFGAGSVGLEIGGLLSWMGILDGFIDNSIEKQGECLLGKEIISLDQYINEHIKESTAVLSMSDKSSKVACYQLEGQGMRRGTDFFLCDDYIMNILPISLLYDCDRLFINMCQISVTERCTLKCVKCAHGCGYNREKAADMGIDGIISSADSFFRYVDHVRYFQLIGGEPLLNGNLSEAVGYIGSKYGDRIYEFDIVTNGTIVPSDELCEACKDHKVTFRISNYSKTIPQLKRSHENIIEKIEEYCIRYCLYGEDNVWMDYGFDHVDHGKKTETLRNVFNSCKTQCREIRGSRFHYCIQARATRDNMGFLVGEKDYLDIDELPEENAKKILLEYSMGYSEKGYLDMCNHCNGADAYKYPIPVAEQMK